MDETKLDPRPARELTSRECAKVLGGPLGGLARLFGADVVEKALQETADSEEFWGFAKDPGNVVHEATAAVVDSIPREELNPLSIMIGAAISGPLTCSTYRKVRTAVRWWAVPGRLASTRGRVV